MKTAHVIVDGLDTAYAELGSGPVVLFLHGWGGDASSLESLAQELSENRKCISLSLPGFGASERPATAWGVLDYAQFVRHFLSKLGAEPDIMCAHSFGGRIAIKGIAAGIFNPRKLVLIASAGVAEKSKQQGALAAAARAGKLLTAIPPFSIFRDSIRRRFGSRDYLNAGPLRETFVKIISENLKEDAKKITVPTLLIWGDGDTETPLSEARTLQECIRGSRLEVLPGSGHFVFQEEPAAVARLIKDFV